MRRALALGAAAVLLLTGCTAPVEQNTEAVHGSADVLMLDRPSGGQVECAIFDGVRAGGISCNWGAIVDGGTP